MLWEVIHWTFEQYLFTPFFFFTLSFDTDFLGLHSYFLAFPPHHLPVLVFLAFPPYQLPFVFFKGLSALSTGYFFFFHHHCLSAILYIIVFCLYPFFHLVAFLYPLHFLSFFFSISFSFHYLLLYSIILLFSALFYLLYELLFPPY